jgi:single-strand DNA-binding protein
MLNTITLIGRIGKDPELKTTDSGTNICTFSLAVTRKMDRDKSDWFNVKCFGKQATFVHEYLAKGRLVAVTGEHINNAYEKDGQKRDWWEVVANNVQGLDRPKDEQPAAPATTPEVDEYDPFEDE